jgi:DNA-binding transcriptional regulator PaaX
LSIYQSNLQLLEKQACDNESMMALLYQEAEAYIQCMRTDPLLPQELLPKTYQGREVFKLHVQIRTALALRL